MEAEGLSPEDKIHLETIAALFQSLDKLVRGMKLYEGKGPLVERLLENVVKKASESLENGEFTLSMTPIGPTYMGAAVLEDGKPPKYLFQMYCDGVRELTFLPGLSDDEINQFVEILFTDIKDPNEDIVTMMWRQSFSHIRYYAVDTLGVQVGDEEDAQLKAKAAAQLKTNEAGEKMKLSSSDIRLLRSDDQLLWMRESRAPTHAPDSMRPFLDKLQEVRSAEQDIKRFIAIAIRCGEGADEQSYALLRSLIDGWQKSGNTQAILSVFRTLLSFLGEDLKMAQVLLSEMLSETSIVEYAFFFNQNPDEWSELVKSLFVHDELPHQNWVLVLKNLELGRARTKLQTVLKEEGVDMTELYLDSLESEEEGIVLNAIEALGQIGSAAAIKGVLSKVNSVLASVRYAVLHAVKGRYDESMRISLLKALRDPDSVNRQLALSILTESSERQIGNGILGVMQNPDFQNYDVNEQEHFFMALSKYSSPTIFQFLDQLLSEKNITRSKKIIDRQLLAIKCLGAMGNDDAKNVLSKASGRWYLAGELKNEIKKHI